MAISITRYVDITSGVGGNTGVANRQLIARLFTTNNLLPPQSFIQFDSAAEVGEYFGTSSQEYLRAVYYFSFLSKNITSPQAISYARWVDAAVAPRVYGYANPAAPQALANYTSISTGSIGLTIGGVVNMFTGIDFTTALSLSDVASILQTKIRTASGTQWTSSTVTYDATAGAFNFVGGSTGTATISVQAGNAGVDISGLISWLPAATMVNGVFVPGAIWANGSAIETISATLTNSAGASNNFGSFAFMSTLTLDQVIEAAEWNKAQNVMFMYSVPVTAGNASAWANLSTGVGEIGGTALTLLSGTTNEYPEMLPMAIEAATDYTRQNAVQNYMFQQSTLTPSVTTDASADAMDALRINYYGQTQTAGQLLAFYQRGVLMGLATDPLDMNTYANEQWLKDAANAALMTLLLTLSEVSANARGRSQILGTLQSVIDQALRNGTISVGKTLTNAQILAITQITNDPNAYYQVQNNGYWVDCVIVPSSGSPVTYTAQYTLVYSKDDIIRKVEGTHVLI